MPRALQAVINAFLSRRENYVVVDRGETVRDLLRIAGEKRVDVLICELSMAGDVYGAIAEIRERHPETLVIIYTGSPSTELAVGALDAGAKGFVLKGSPIEELEDALEAVCAGSVYISPRFAPRVITALQAARIEREEARLPPQRRVSSNSKCFRPERRLQGRQRIAPSTCLAISVEHADSLRPGRVRPAHAASFSYPIDQRQPIAEWRRELL